MKQSTYSLLTPFERQEFLAKFIHCIKGSEVLYESAQEIIQFGYQFGMFKNVKIGLEVTTVENQE